MEQKNTEISYRGLGVSLLWREPYTRKLITGKMFPSTMAQVEEEAWVAFMNVVSGFLGKKKDLEYGRLVNDMLENFEKLGCNLNLKLHFLDLHLDFFFTESC
ncbi:Polyphosphoinositide phosphatase [Trichinella pseudospiralis]